MTTNEVPEVAKREPVGYLFTSLDWNFIYAMAKLAKHGSDKYDTPGDSTPNYQKSILGRDKSPLNHLCRHLTSYMNKEEHDHFGHMKWHLVAIAFNAMMEFFWASKGDGMTTYSKKTQQKIDDLSDIIAFKHNKVTSKDYQGL